MSSSDLTKQKKQIGTVMVVGGGVAGVQASLDLAELGYYVYLIEASPVIGGVMAQLDKTFPTLDCSLCILSPKLVECGRHRNIEIITNAEIKGIEGVPGNFRCQVKRRARYVDREKCNACGTCVNYCPIEIKDSYNENLANVKCIYLLYPQAVPAYFAIDEKHCLYLSKKECTQCAEACGTDAINFKDKDEILTLEVGSIILAPGFEEFNAGLKAEYGYGRYPNVVTSIQFERIMCASGPYLGEVKRPSDGKHPKRVAFIQCVGSRDVQEGNPYCSTVCCTYAIKESIVVKEHDPSLQITIFFMDMRTMGKGFEQFYERGKKEFNLNFIRSKATKVKRVPETENLIVRYVNENGVKEEKEFDMVILSVGMEPCRGYQALADSLKINLNPYGFCETHEFTPLKTNREGIYVAGAYQSPKDIPESVMQASGAVALCSGLLSASRGTRVKEKVFPPEIDISGEEPCIGVFVCHCGINIAGVVDVTEVTEYVRTLPNVAYAEENMYSCSQDSQVRIKELIKEHKLNRVIVAACTPRTHEPLFQETIREAGLNRCLFEMANIRDQNSWVHMHEKERATKKAKDLIRSAVSKARLLSALPEQKVKVTPRGLVIGGGIAGMTAALEIARQGYECYLVEKEKELGGNLRKLYFTLDGHDPQKFLNETIEKVQRDPRITVLTSTAVTGVSGYVGNFRTQLVRNENGSAQPMEIEHGVIVVATGAKEYKPEEYLYGKSSKVITQQELEEKLGTDPSQICTMKDIVMIQCVGSREPHRIYCSKLCCSKAIKNALKIKELNPDSNVYILYRDIRTYGFKEDAYNRARDAGVMFIRYDLEGKPEVKEGETLEIKVFDPILREDVLIKSDLLILSPAIVTEGNEELGKLLKVSLTDDKFFLEAHVKLRPVDFATDGIFLCGLAHSPKPLEESIVQAQAAAARAAIPLARGEVEVEPIVSSVDQELCFGCGICEYNCPYKAIRVVSTERGERAETITASCKGCGVCAARCPKQAINMGRYTYDQISAQIAAIAGG
jgi:heterodisulfide reductase subunit A